VAATLCLRSLQVDSVFVFIRQVAVLRHVGYLRHPQQVTFESGVTCDLGYLRANFSLPRPLCARLRPDARDKTDRRQTKASLNASTLRRRRHNNLKWLQSDMLILANVLKTESSTSAAVKLEQADLTKSCNRDVVDDDHVYLAFRAVLLVAEFRLFRKV